MTTIFFLATKTDAPCTAESWRPPPGIGLVLLAMMLPSLLYAGGLTQDSYLPMLLIREFQHHVTVDDRLEPDFARKQIPYPPAGILLVAFKSERKVEMYAEGQDGKLRHIRDYPLLGKSGKLGPKLREGDRQIPEGIYRVTWLNPSSFKHLSMLLDYPNAFDREMAKKEGRGGLGGEIMIHGGASSAGCLAVGDDAAEDLFILGLRMGIEKVRVIISPVDFRARLLPTTEPILTTPFSDQLYQMIRAELKRLPERN